LLEAYRRHLRATCELHLVTKAQISAEPGVSVYSNYGPDDPRLLKLFQDADILVLPTVVDCFSIASIEAMACGLPVITCPVGGIPEIIGDGVTGCLVPVGDGRRLVQSITSLAADPARCRAMGEAGRNVAVDRFNATKQTRQLLNVILGSVP